MFIFTGPPLLYSASEILYISVQTANKFLERKTIGSVNCRNDHPYLKYHSQYFQMRFKICWMFQTTRNETAEVGQENLLRIVRCMT